MSQPCEKFILDSLRRSPCRIEAFDGREFDKRTVNESLTALMHANKVVYAFSEGVYRFNPNPKPKRYPTPNLKIGRKVDGFDKARLERKQRAQRYSGPLEDNSSTARGGGRNGNRNQ